MDSIINFITWPNVAGIIFAYYGTLVFYRLFLHPLAGFPGPKLAAISRWYEGYFDVIQGGKYTLKIAELHRQYGPIIRISPYELHISDPAFFDRLYRQDGRWDKHAWMYDAFGAKTSTVFGADHDAHKARRHAIAPFFSRQKVAARQYIIHQNVDKLVERISRFSNLGITLNLGAAISAFTRDVVNEFVTGKTYGELELVDFGIGLSIASQGAGVFWRTTKFIRWFGPSIRSIPIDWALKLADDGTKSFLSFLQRSEQDTKDTLAAVKTTSLSDGENHHDAAESGDTQLENTMVHAIVHSNLPSVEKKFERVFEEIATVTAAGYETTANTLRLILYHVFSNPEILGRLRDEISSVSSTAESGVPTPPLSTLEQLPYLTAVLKEGLRLSPGIGTRAGRVSDKDLFYDQWRIPAGTPVGMTTLLLHTDETMYRDPMRFDPDRWLTHKIGERDDDDDKPRVFAPFSRGTRICLGMHLAWAKMYLLLASLVQHFDFTIEGGITAADFEFERDNFGIGTKAGCNLFVTARQYMT